MGRRRNLSVEKRASILALRNEGLKIRYISERLKIPKSSVADAIKRFGETHSNEDKKRSGRPRVTSKAEDQSIILTSKMNRKLTATNIRSEFIDSHKKSVSTATIKRRLCGAQLNGRVATKKPLLRRGNKKKRLNWARKHKNWTIDDWKKVLWTDESKFELFGGKRRVFVRRATNEKMHPDCVLPTVKHGGGSVMVWGCFSFAGGGDLYRIKGILDQKGYHSILKNHAVPSGKRLVGKGFVFQQDNDPKHTSKLCAKYLESKQKSGELHIMQWPPQSPDLNPIELVWDEIDRQVRKKTHSSAQSLWDSLQESWRETPQEVFQKLVERMPRVVKSVLSARGGFFDETKV